MGDYDLTPDKIEKMKQKFGKNYVEKAQQIDKAMQENGGKIPDFVMQDLNPKQTDTLKRLLSDSDAINKLLSSEQAQKLLKKMFEED